ncbi:hypothetical protein [Nitrogeniibacter aestuarii]|uniref:hypothetical protein n=1 Tax=Nitrogeniibacter aestuarii TaxID=2815343 RepID=UPI001D1267D6|nr:hypothetical protein [Nitrogeniibacter aestuarii]
MDSIASPPSSRPSVAVIGDIGFACVVSQFNSLFTESKARFSFGFLRLIGEFNGALRAKITGMTVLPAQCLACVATSNSFSKFGDS